jgi:hypothetical protein
LTLTARLLSRNGKPMHDVPVSVAGLAGPSNQIDLPLAGLAPDEYTLELVASSSAGEGRERIPFRVTN